MSRRIPSPFGLAWNFAKYNIGKSLTKRPFLPKLLTYYVNYRCNARCVMCGIWENQHLFPKESELNVEQFDRILADRLFSKIERVNINGGELSLRSDLPEMMQVMANRLPRLREVGLSSNGLLADRLVSQVRQIRDIFRTKNISLSVIISLHGISETQDRVFGVKGAFDRQVKTLDALQELAQDLGINIGAYCVISKENIDHLQELQNWAKARHLNIGYSIVEKRERFDNLEKGAQYEIADQDKAVAADFIRRLSRPKGVLNASAYTYDYMANLLQYNRKRTMSCDYSLGGVILGSQGELFYCPHSEMIGDCKERSAYDIFYDVDNLARRDETLIKRKCLYCPPREVGTLAIQVDIFKYLGFVLRNRQK